MKADRDGSSAGKEKAADRSPFATVAAILCWEAFHMVQVLWMGVIDLPVSSAEKDWTLQVWVSVSCRGSWSNSRVPLQLPG